MNKINEECGVFGIFCQRKTNVAANVYYGLFALQHRGQESCGIVVNDDGVFSSYKDVGLVNDVFTKSRIENLGDGNMAIGHVRYGAANTDARSHAQPMVVNHMKGHTAIAHNGCLVNADVLREKLESEGSIFHSTSDTEVISYILTKERLKSKTLEEALDTAMNIIKGAYSIVIMTPTKIIAARDENGFRPLCYGKTSDGDYIIASETCALDSVGAEYIRDIEPGEILVFSKEGINSIRSHCNKKEHKICIFEYIYFARPDSVIEGKSVHKARMNAGACLAMEHPVDADIVIGVPDSGLDAALGFSRQSGIPYGIGFIKNRYIGRTFISPGQKSRENLVRIKLNPISENVKGKRVVLVDDSIVRGTTSAQIVKLLRDAGASEIHMRISSPPFLNPCYYGTDIDSKEWLIACNHSIDEIKTIIGVDTLGYLSMDSLAKLIGTTPGSGYCDACFSGNYPTDTPVEKKKSKFEYKISEGREE